MEKSCKAGRHQFAPLMFGAVGETNQTAKAFPWAFGAEISQKHTPSQRYLENRRVSLSLGCNPSFPLRVLLGDPLALMSLLNLPVVFFFSLISRREREKRLDSVSEITAGFDSRSVSEEFFAVVLIAENDGRQQIRLQRTR